MFVAQLKTGKPDIGLMANGMLAGLVAITAPCAFVDSVGASIIGAVAGALLVYSIFFVDETLKIDDPVGAISVHGVNGAWGVLSLGLFADGKYGEGFNGVAGGVTGLFYGGGMSQMYAQIVGTATCGIFVFRAFYVFFKVVGVLIGNRVPAEVEIAGLDIAEVGALAYAPDFEGPEAAAAAARTASVPLKALSPTEAV
jgi:ammonium transporter, Amt family